MKLQKKIEKYFIIIRSGGEFNCFVNSLRTCKEFEHSYFCEWNVYVKFNSAHFGFKNKYFKGEFFFIKLGNFYIDKWNFAYPGSRNDIIISGYDFIKKYRRKPK